MSEEPLEVDPAEPSAELAEIPAERSGPRLGHLAGRRVLDGGASVMRRLDALRLEYIYLVVALVWGLALVAIMPPFQVPDEPAHFFRAWGLAEGHIFPPRDLKENLPTNVWLLQTEFPIGNIGDPAHYQGYDPGKIPRLLGEPISSTHVDQQTAVPSQNPVAYVPQALGVEIARVTGFSPLGAFYLARLFNLLVAVALVFFAIRLMPFGKVMLLLVALFPVTLSEMASISPDALMIAAAFLFTGLMMNYAARKSLGTKQMLAALAVGGVLLTVKPGYFPMVALVFLLRPRQFSSTKRYAAWLSSIIVAVVLLSVVMALAEPKVAADAATIGPAPAGTDAIAQFKHVLAHPFGFVRALLNTFGAAGVGFFGYWMVGLLGWLTINVSQVAALLMFGLIVVFMGGFDQEPPVGRRDRTVMLLTWAATMLSTCLALYAALNVVGGSSVNGIQGRYLTPMFPLLLLGIYRLRLRRRSYVVILLLVGLALVAVSTMRAVWYHFLT